MVERRLFIVAIAMIVSAVFFSCVSGIGAGRTIVGGLGGESKGKDSDEKDDKVVGKWKDKDSGEKNVKVAIPKIKMDLDKDWHHKKFEDIDWNGGDGQQLRDKFKVEFEEWKTKNGKTDKDFMEFWLWRTQKEKDPKIPGKPEGTDDDVRGDCFKDPTKKMRQRVEHCKCQVLNDIVSFAPVGSRPAVEALVKPQLANSKPPAERKPGQKRKKCDTSKLEAMPNIGSAFKLMVRACFWKKMKMLVPGEGGELNLDFKMVKEVMGRFETKPEVLKEVHDGIEKCKDGQLTAENVPPEFDKIMPIKEIKKSLCIGKVYKKYCTDIGPASPNVDSKTDGNDGKKNGGQGGWIKGVIQHVKDEKNKDKDDSKEQNWKVGDRDGKQGGGKDKDDSKEPNWKISGGKGGDQNWKNGGGKGGDQNGKNGGGKGKDDSEEHDGKHDKGKGGDNGKGKSGVRVMGGNG